VGPQIFDWPDFLGEGECAAAIALAAQRQSVAAPVYGGDGGTVNPAMRRARTCLLERDAETAWLFARLDALFAAAAPRFGVAVDPLFEPVQVIRYGPGDHFQLWHSDAGLDRVDQRRLSASIELSDPGSYEGGLLEIAPGRMLPQHSPGQGHATIFPSRMLHHVTPVTRGVRHALVAWAGLNAP
jgi:PKHD-type hydroxylase